MHLHKIRGKCYVGVHVGDDLQQIAVAEEIMALTGDKLPFGLSGLRLDFLELLSYPTEFGK